MLRLGVPLLACLLALAGGAAHAAKPREAAFRVTLSATLTKAWTFTRTESEAGCARTIRGVGSWEGKLTSRRPIRVRAVSAPGGRVRFNGATLRAITGAATLTGTMTMSARGAPPCNRPPNTVRCAVHRRSTRGVFVSFGSPRRGILRFGTLRGFRPIRSFNTTCPEEPEDVRAVRIDLPLATGPLDAADVFTPSVRRWFITGDAEQLTTIEGDVPGRVTERVRWRLVFTRITRS
jgi:hypothetical protein